MYVHNIYQKWHTLRHAGHLCLSTSHYNSTTPIPECILGSAHVTLLRGLFLPQPTDAHYCSSLVNIHLESSWAWTTPGSMLELVGKRCRDEYTVVRTKNQPALVTSEPFFCLLFPKRALLSHWIIWLLLNLLTNSHTCPYTTFRRFNTHRCFKMNKIAFSPHFLNFSSICPPTHHTDLYNTILNITNNPISPPLISEPGEILPFDHGCVFLSKCTTPFWPGPWPIPSPLHSHVMRVLLSVHISPLLITSTPLQPIFIATLLMVWSCLISWIPFNAPFCREYRQSTCHRAIPQCIASYPHRMPLSRRSSCPRTPHPARAPSTPPPLWPQNHWEPSTPHHLNALLFYSSRFSGQYLLSPNISRK